MDSMIKEVRDLTRLVEPPIGRRITALGVQMATFALSQDSVVRLEPAGVPGKPRARRHRRRATPTIWVADSKARRVPTWVIKATDGLETKAKIIDRYGPGAKFEVGKPLPAQLSAAARKAMKAPQPATNQRQAEA
jgi:hypothetical protein